MCARETLEGLCASAELCHTVYRKQEAAQVLRESPQGQAILVCLLLLGTFPENKNGRSPRYFFCVHYSQPINAFIKIHKYLRQRSVHVSCNETIW